MSGDFSDMLVMVKGAGDLGSGVALRLHRCGFAVAMTEIDQPLTVRRGVAFGQAVFDGAHTVEGAVAERCRLDEALHKLAQGVIPLLVDPAAAARSALRPAVLVDAIMAKQNTGTALHHARLVVALGPGFVAGHDCHAVVETQRGHNLGRVIWEGGAEPDTGEPGVLPGASAHASRVLRAPVAGYVHSAHQIGEHVRAGQAIAVVRGVDGAEAPIMAPFDGVLRGLLHPSVLASPGMKIGDLDPRIEPDYCFTVSDKSLAIAGGVLEAILHARRQAYVRR